MRTDSTMRPEGENGSTTTQNGSTSPKQTKITSATNGNHTQNGALNLKNGLAKTRSTYVGHDTEEITRLCLQALSDLGYTKAVSTLSEESGFKLETAAVTAFRDAILHGQWDLAEEILFGSSDIHPDHGDTSPQLGLSLTEGANINAMKFCLRKQKFLELLEARQTTKALQVLRMELQPLRIDVRNVHFLSSLVMIQRADDLRRKACWDGVEGSSRHELLTALSSKSLLTRSF